MPIFASGAPSPQSPSAALEHREEGELFPTDLFALETCGHLGFTARPRSQFLQLPARAALHGLLNAEYLFPPSLLSTNPSSASSCSPSEAFVTGAMVIYLLFTEHCCSAAGQPHPQPGAGDSPSWLRSSQLKAPKTSLPTPPDGLPDLSAAAWCSPCQGRMFSAVFQSVLLFLLG